MKQFLLVGIGSFAATAMLIVATSTPGGLIG
jgi:hypothetical protein